uniref:Putative heat-schock protein 1 n=1 Tax=Arabidopsis cebennensis TaxID=97979 RepID=B2BY13_9BRAS|nr:putative heat-schock protein 1 [Arabidopsis cebennensis]
MSMIPSFFNNNRRGNNIFDPFSLDVWDPFKELTSSSLSRENSAIVNARVDWRETPEAHVFKADLPGLKKEEVKVEIEEDSVLKISGERHVEKEDKNDTWHRVERSSGQFTRRFRLPENVKMDQVNAAMENGVLTVTVPKAVTKKADVKSIQITEEVLVIGAHALSLFSLFSFTEAKVDLRQGSISLSGLAVDLRLLKVVAPKLSCGVVAKRVTALAIVFSSRSVPSLRFCSGGDDSYLIALRLESLTAEEVMELKDGSGSDPLSPSIWSLRPLIGFGSFLASLLGPFVVVAAWMEFSERLSTSVQGGCDGGVWRCYVHLRLPFVASMWLRGGSVRLLRFAVKIVSSVAPVGFSVGNRGGGLV